MQRTAQKGNMSTDRLTAGKTGNGLIYHRLKNGGGQILLGSAFVDKGLDICFGKYTAAGGNSIQGLVIFGIFI